MTILFLFFPSSAFAANSGIFTVELWVKPTSSIASQALVGKAEEFRVFTDASGNAGCQIKSTTWQTASTGTTALTLNAWNHVACAYDKSSLKVYVNGVLANSNSLTATIDDTANAILLGQDSSASTPYSNLTGTTDDFKFYNYARTQDQIISDMQGNFGTAAFSLSSSGLTGGSNTKPAAPVGYWKFDEGYGTTANNVGNGGSALNGTLTGMSSPATSTSGWTQSGKFGKGLVFDGINDYVTIPTNTALGPSNITMSAWIKATSLGGRVIDKITAGGADGYLMDTNGSKIRICANACVSSTTSLSTNTWYHIVITFDGTTTRFYLNGLADGSSTSITSLPTNVLNLRLGIDQNGTNPFSGTIDEVKIYPYALTADQVKLDMNQGASQVLGALSDNSSYQPQAASQEYCVPGDTATCSAPVGRWDFEEGTGTTVNDSSGNANTGTWAGTGTHWANGKSGNGKTGNFNGSDDYVNVADPPSGILDFGISDSFTISFWLKTNDSDTITNLVTKYDGSAQYYTVEIRSSGKAYFELSTAGASTLLTGTTIINNGNWHFVTAVRNVSTDLTYIYIDGKLDASTADLSGNLANAGNLTIGNVVGVAGRQLNGLIDNVKIYNYARSASQIAWDYNRGGPVGWWKFDECQGAVANDSSGNSNTGTITIGATGTQTSAGTCTDGLSTSAWNNGKTGKRNYSLNFDGTDDYVTVPDNDLLDITTTWTLATWIKRAGTTVGTYDDIFDKGGCVGGFSLYFSSDNKVNFVIQCVTAFSVSQSAITDTNWHYLVLTRDSSNNYKFYLDGVLENTVNTASAPSANTGAFLIGGGLSWPLVGQIDDVRVYNYPLTATQIKTLYSDGAYRVGPSTGAP